MARRKKETSVKKEELVDLSELKANRTACDENDTFAIDSIAIETDERKHNKEIEVSNSKEAQIGLKEGSIKVMDGGYYEINKPETQQMQNER